MYYSRKDLINISNYIPINFTYYDPRNSLFKAGKSDRERVTIYTCNNSENCDACKRNKCVMLNGLYFHPCPYGQTKREEGYTKAARRCGDLIQKKKDEYGDVAYSKSDLKFVCYIGDYVFLPLPHLINYSNSIRENSFFKGDGNIIRKEDFTPEFIVELIKYRPRAMMGGEITSYQRKEVPKFCSQLKRYMPDMFEKVKTIYPEIEDRIEDIDYQNKYARVVTLLPGKVKLSTKIVEWDGSVIRAKGDQLTFWGLSKETVIITPDESTYVQIVDNATVTDDTEFKDE